MNGSDRSRVGEFGFKVRGLGGTDRPAAIAGEFEPCYGEVQGKLARLAGFEHDMRIGAYDLFNDE
ncbi:MAG: hypothetical protein ABSF53_00585 [Terracidiphilus sp.]